MRGRERKRGGGREEKGKEGRKREREEVDLCLTQVAYAWVSGKELGYLGELRSSYRWVFRSEHVYTDRKTWLLYCNSEKN